MQSISLSRNRWKARRHKTSEIRKTLSAANLTSGKQKISILLSHTLHIQKWLKCAQLNTQPLRGSREPPERTAYKGCCTGDRSLLKVVCLQQKGHVLCNRFRHLCSACPLLATIAATPIQRVPVARASFASRIPGGPGPS